MDHARAAIYEYEAPQDIAAVFTGNTGEIRSSPLAPDLKKIASSNASAEQKIKMLDDLFKGRGIDKYLDGITTYDKNMNKLNVTMESLSLTVGNELLPTATDILGKINDFLVGLGGNAKYLVYLTGLVAVLAALGGVGGLALQGLSGIASAGQLLFKGMGKIPGVNLPDWLTGKKDINAATVNVKGAKVNVDDDGTPNPNKNSNGVESTPFFFGKGGSFWGKASATGVPLAGLSASQAGMAGGLGGILTLLSGAYLTESNTMLNDWMNQGSAASGGLLTFQKMATNTPIAGQMLSSGMSGYGFLKDIIDGKSITDSFIHAIETNIGQNLGFQLFNFDWPSKDDILGLFIPQIPGFTWSIPGIWDILTQIDPKIGELIWSIPGLSQILGTVAPKIDWLNFPNISFKSIYDMISSHVSGHLNFNNIAATAATAVRNAVAQVKANTQGPPRGPSGIGGFISQASGTYGGFKYSGYGGFSGRNVLDIIGSGNANCVDGTMAQAAIAQAAGVPFQIVADTWLGNPHIRGMANFGGGYVSRDISNKSISGSWSRPPAGPSNGSSGNTLIIEKGAINITGPVYGIDDLDNKIQGSIKQALNEQESYADTIIR